VSKPDNPFAAGSAEQLIISAMLNWHCIGKPGLINLLSHVQKLSTLRYQDYAA